MQGCGGQPFHNKLPHTNHFPHRSCPILEEVTLQVLSSSPLAFRGMVPVTPNVFCFMRTVTSEPELKGCKSSVSFRNILMQKIMPTAACVSQSNSQRFDQVERNAGGSTDTNTTVDLVEDSLPGMRSPRENPFGHRERKQIINEVEINQWLEKETGIDRLRIMYATGPGGVFIQEDTQKINTMFRRTVVLGAFVSVLAAAAQASGKKEKHISKTQAVLKGVMNERTEAKTVLKEAFKTTLKFTAFAASIFHLSQAIAAYRNKTSVWEYIISATLGLGVSGVGQGVKRCAVLSFTGALLGSIGGFLACRVLTSEGLSQEQKHIDRIRQYLQQQRLIQQKALPTLTDEQDAS